jgi:hypothetical protein
VVQHDVKSMAGRVPRAAGEKGAVLCDAIIQESKRTRAKIFIVLDLWQAVDWVYSNLFVPVCLDDEFPWGLGIMLPKRMKEHIFDHTIPVQICVCV